ncbi:MAG: DUF2203 domain-containing protein [Chloroflexi bacterium]|nr:DUF2203 domain-containing protein [Chloroflexota bacterium]
MPRYFSREEANALLPALRTLLGRIQRLVHDLAKAKEELKALMPPTKGNGHASHSTEIVARHRQIEERRRQINETVEEAQALGCEVKDIERGLIDFLALREGREVYLCWHMGEEQVEWWHALETGYRGRQRL